MFNSGGAAHSRLRTAKPLQFTAMIFVALRCISAGLTIILTG